MSFGVMVASPENLVWMCRSIRVGGFGRVSLFFLIFVFSLVLGLGRLQ